jgi:hypothetical protein
METNTKDKQATGLRFNTTTIVIACALTLFTGIYSYLANAQLDVKQLLFLFLVFYAVLVIGTRLWIRVKSSRRRRL